LKTTRPVFLHSTATEYTSFKYATLEDGLLEMNHCKTTLIFGSIVVAGALTGVALAILLQQFLEDREKDVSVIGTHGNSIHGKNDVVKSAYGPSAFSVSETTSSNGGTTNR
jgi:hypothetical protein